MRRAIPTAEQLPVSLREGLDRLAAQAIGPFGHTPLARLVAVNLFLFTDMRRQGASWDQIVGLLAERGTIAPARSLNADVLRATYARARGTLDAATNRDGSKRSRTQCDETHRNETKRGEAELGEIGGGETERSAAEHYETKDGGATHGRAVPNARRPDGRRSISTDNVTAGQDAGRTSRPTPRQIGYGTDALLRRAALVRKPPSTR